MRRVEYTHRMRAEEPSWVWVQLPPGVAIELGDAARSEYWVDAFNVAGVRINPSEIEVDSDPPYLDLQTAVYSAATMALRLHVSAVDAIALQLAVPGLQVLDR
jgi:hypothetical protein